MCHLHLLNISVQQFSLTHHTIKINYNTSSTNPILSSIIRIKSDILKTPITKLLTSISHPSNTHRVAQIMHAESAATISAMCISALKLGIYIVNDWHFDKWVTLQRLIAAYCHGRNSLSSLCSYITGDALLYSMFREKANPVACPFHGPMTFTYNRGHGRCSVPQSNVDTCTDESRLLFRYQACPDVHASESTGELIFFIFY